MELSGARCQYVELDIYCWNDDYRQDKSIYSNAKI